MRFFQNYVLKVGSINLVYYLSGSSIRVSVAFGLLLASCCLSLNHIVGVGLLQNPNFQLG